MYIVS